MMIGFLLVVKNASENATQALPTRTPGERRRLQQGARAQRQTGRHLPDERHHLLHYVLAEGNNNK